MQLINPDNITKPASHYSQGVVVDAAARRLIISGQIGVTPDGDVLDGIAAQMRQAWHNVFAVVEAAGMRRQDLVKVTVFLTNADDVPLYREMRDEMLDGHAPASTLLIISALASPALVVEIEAEAVTSS
jgi:enamine deaminase RidA (YjgF/YER057c/UK114 family)